MNSNYNYTENTLNSDELLKYAEKPKLLIPLWEFILAFILGLIFSLLYFFGSFNTLENRMLTKNSLIEKGYKVTQKIENADMILYGGCESSDIQSVATLLLVDVKTEEEYIIAKGSYGMGMDLKGDMKGALKNALKSIPNK